MREADYLSRYHATTIVVPLLPKLLVEYWWSEEYNCTIQSVCATFFFHSCFYYSEDYCSEEGMFYCDFGLGMPDTYLSGWYTHLEFNGDHFSPLCEPRRIAFYDARYYGRRGNFP